MYKRFEQQTAIITGGAEGLGKGIAKRIAEEGGRVVLLDINDQLLQHTLQEMQIMYPDTLGYRVDISDESQVQKVFNEIDDICGSVEIVINAAGIVGATGTKITAYTVEDYDRIYAVNLKGAFLVTKNAVRLMEPQDYGRILLIASIAGKEGNPFMAGYSSTKAGVIGLVKGVGKELATTGITVNGLAPAVIKTAMNAHTAPEQLAYMTSKIPMNRLGTVEEVAAISAWIVSREASFNTGVIFDLSGGRATY
ncbi:MAG TPA: SDR family NAD(P)-dependent oxidoreductase [Niabella sp.]